MLPRFFFVEKLFVLRGMAVVFFYIYEQKLKSTDDDNYFRVLSFRQGVNYPELLLLW